MPLGAFRLNSLARYVAPVAASRSWDIYDGSADSAEFELTDYDVTGSTTCFVDGRLLVASVTNTVSANTINLRLFDLSTDDPNNYSVTLLDSDSFTTGSVSNQRFMKMARIDTDKVIFFCNAYSVSARAGQETIIITTSNGSISLGTLQFHDVNDAYSQVLNGGGLLPITSSKVVGIGGQNRSLSLWTISGTTVTFQASLNAATIFTNTPRTECWANKINDDRIVVATSYNKTGSSTSHLEDINAAILDISANTFSTITTSQGIATTSTNDYYSWGNFGRGFFEYGSKTGIILTNQRTVNAGRASQTKTWPGTAVLTATTSAITGHSASDTWSFEFENELLEFQTTDFTSGSPAFPTVADHPYTVHLKDDYFLVFVRTCNSTNRETDESYHQVHILKLDGMSVAPPTDSSYSPKVVYSKPQGAYLFDFDNALAHRIDDDTAVVTYNKGRASSTIAPNGRVGCMIIKAPSI